jgi:hypothetical protein
MGGRASETTILKFTFWVSHTYLVAKCVFLVYLELQAL